MKLTSQCLTERNDGIDNCDGDVLPTDRVEFASLGRGKEFLNCWVKR